METANRLKCAVCGNGTFYHIPLPVGQGLYSCDSCGVRLSPAEYIILLEMNNIKNILIGRRGL